MPCRFAFRRRDRFCGGNANRGNLKPEEKRLSAKRGDGVRHGVSAGVIYCCDTRWEIDRPQGNIVFRDCEFDRPGQVFALDYDGRNMWCCRHPLESIAFEGCTFRSVERPISIFGARLALGRIRRDVRRR